MRSRCAILVPILLCAFILTPAVPLAGERYAIVVGHNIGAPGEAALRYAEQDASIMKNVLIELGGVQRTNATLLLAPNSRMIDAAIEETANKAKRAADANRSSTLFFYYTGHGDSDSLHLGKERYLRATLEKKLEAVATDVTLSIIDACQTPPSAQPMGVHAGPSFEVDVLRTHHPRGVVTIQSTQKGEPAYESEALKGAVFTHHLISALRGGGDADRDGRVTLLEAYSFAYRHTIYSSAQVSAHVQFPGYNIDLKGAEDLVLTSPEKADALLILDNEEQAVFMVFRQPEGTLLAEVAASKQTPVVLAVPRGRLLVQRRVGDRLQAAEVDIPFGGRHEVASYEFEDVSYETMTRKGGSLKLSPDRLHLGYLFKADRFTSSWIIRNGFGLGYGRYFNHWRLGLDLSAGFSRYQGESYNTREMVIDLTLIFGSLFYLDMTTLFVGLGPMLELIAQHNERLQADRLEPLELGIETRTDDYALGVGGQLQLMLFMPIYRSMEIYLKVLGSIIAIPIEKQRGRNWIPVYDSGGEIGVKYRF